jgi:CubicO group peptidase (beta-lactamase class C family)
MHPSILSSDRCASRAVGPVGSPRVISGFVHPDFGAVTETLRRVVSHRDGGGAAVAVYHQGELVVDAWTGTRNAAGDPWQSDTMAMCFSTTKGVVATTVHRLVDRGLIDYDAPVAAYWPEFAAGGKERVTVRNLLDHSAGLHQLRGVISSAYDMLDWDLVCSRLAAESPRYEPGTRHGYHGITFGFLVGEVIRRVTGTTVHEAVETEIVKPLDLDGMSIGVPLNRRDRVAELIVHARDPERVERLARRAERTSWLRPAIEAFVIPDSDRLFGSFEVLDSEIPAANGCFTARSLARMYAALAGGGVLDGDRFLSADTLRRATEIQSTGRDIVLGIPMHWRLGYHAAATSRGVIPNGFGHFGLGGSGAWADPDNDLAIAFVCNRMAGTPVGDLRLLRIGARARAAAMARGGYPKRTGSARGPRTWPPAHVT